MAHLSDLDSGDGVGILQPNLKNRFRISFYDPSGPLLSYSDAISLQTVRVTSISQTIDHHTSDVFVIVVEDDVTNSAGFALQKLLKEAEFIVRLETLNGYNEVMKMLTIEHAFAEVLVHSDLDYASNETCQIEVVIEYDPCFVSAT